MSVQRFRSTTPQSTEAVSEIVASTTESIVSIEPSKIGDEKMDTTTSPLLTNTLPWIGSSSTPNDDILPVETEAGRTEEAETERAILSTTSESSSTTTDSVKLVEDSATEILLTTAPASLSTLSIPNTRISTASVSQPRPFGFNRRNRPSSSEPTTTTTTTTTPLPPSNDQTRTKVSIPSRNNTRSSLLVGRGRLRPRQEKHGRNVESSHDDEGDEGAPARTRARPSSRIRGASRYTPPTFKLRNESSTSSDSTLQGERVRATTEPPLNTEGGSSRRRFRRPASKISTTTITTITTESTRANELEDSPIVRIVQAYPRRSLSSRSRNAVKEDGDIEKITNIKILKTPIGQVNRDVYARTRYTRKRNNVSTPDTTSSPPPSFLDRTTNDAVTVPLTTTERPILNSIDEVAIETTTTTTSITTQETTTDLETSTMESTMENEVITEVTDDHRTEGLDATTMEDDEIVDTNVIKIANNISETINEENTNALHPRRRKVLLRRRPVTTTQMSVERESRPHTRRRKVIKRLRPVQNATSATDVPSTEQILFVGLVSTMTPKEEEEGISTITDASTENLATAVTVTETIDITDDFAMTLETPTTVESVLGDDTSSFDFDPVTMASTIIDNVTAIASESTTEESTVTETDSVESTSSNFSNDILDEKLLTNELPTIVSWPTSTASISQSNRRLEAYNRTYYLDSKYVRRKFVGRRPVVPSSSENFNSNDRNSIVETSSYLSTSEKNKLEGVSKRRKSLFVRRRPVSSTTSRTTIDDEERDPRFDTEEVTLRNNDETSYPTTPPIDQESEEFSNRYTTTPSIIEKLSSPLTRNATLDEDTSEDTSSILENEDRTHEPIPSTGDRSPEIRPRYRVPVFIKKTLSTENVYPLDSNESEEANNPRSRYQNFRQPRTRYKYREIRRNRESEEESIPDATQSPSYDSSTQVRTRFYARRPTVSTTETPVTETLIPAKKFDYAADAHRRQQQSLRTTTSRTTNRNEDSTTLTNSNEERAEIGNLVVEEDYTTTPSPQPLITRLVTSVEESGTTERQKILIKTKYSSLTSTTKIPLQATIVPLEYSVVTSSSIPGITLEKSDEDESMNEIRQSHLERSTLPIESEFLYPSRFTTESHESSTIEIESVFSNLIGNRDSAK